MNEISVYSYPAQTFKNIFFFMKPSTGASEIYVKVSVLLKFILKSVDALSYDPTL